MIRIPSRFNWNPPSQETLDVHAIRSEPQLAVIDTWQGPLLAWVARVGPDQYHVFQKHRSQGIAAQYYFQDEVRILSLLEAIALREEHAERLAKKSRWKRQRAKKNSASVIPCHPVLLDEDVLNSEMRHLRFSGTYKLLGPPWLYYWAKEDMVVVGREIVGPTRHYMAVTTEDYGQLRVMTTSLADVWLRPLSALEVIAWLEDHDRS